MGGVGSGRSVRDIAGRRFGDLVAVERVGTSIGKHALWACRCDFGTIHVESARDLARAPRRRCACRDAAEQAAAERSYRSFKADPNNEATSSSDPRLTDRELSELSASGDIIGALLQPDADLQAMLRDSLCESKGYVYFVQGGSGGPIKIGTTVGLISRRLAVLQSMSPVPLTHLATTRGGRSVELALHQRFADLRMHGEWFRPEEELVTFIRRLPPVAQPVSPWMKRNRRAA